MRKKFFIVSDVHGHYQELMTALKNVGYDTENEEHIFVSCGDLFDRGAENDKVYEFVKGLKNKILIKGNHEDILFRVLIGRRMTDDALANGTDITVAQIFGKDAVDGNSHFDKESNKEKTEEMLVFLDSMLNYYESGNYVLTHGWLPIVFESRYPEVNPMWREATDFDWNDARWLEWQQLYGVKATLDGKTIVCGHRPARLGYMFDDRREPDCNEPFYGEGMIAIDAHTVRSGFVNVLVIEENA